MGLLARQHGLGAWVSWGAALLFCQLPVARAIGWEVAASLPAVFFSLLSLALLKQAPRSSRAAFFSGLFAGAAVSTRLTFAVTPCLILCAFWFEAGSPRPARARWIALGAGLFAGLFPALFYLADDPASFVFNVFTYHRLTTLYRTAIGFTEGATFASQLWYYKQFVAQPHILAFLGITLAAAAAHPRKAALLLPLLTLPWLAVLLPRAVFHTYFALPEAALLLSAIKSLGILRDTRPGWYKRMLPVCLFLVAAQVWRTHAPVAARWRENGHAFSTAGIDLVRSAGRSVREVAGRSEAPKDIFTLAPIVLCEAGLPFHPALSSGPFIYRLYPFAWMREYRRIPVVQASFALLERPGGHTFSHALLNIYPDIETACFPALPKAVAAEAIAPCWTWNTYPPPQPRTEEKEEKPSADKGLSPR